MALITLSCSCKARTRSRYMVRQVRSCNCTPIASRRRLSVCGHYVGPPLPSPSQCFAETVKDLHHLRPEPKSLCHADNVGHEGPRGKTSPAVLQMQYQKGTYNLWMLSTQRKTCPSGGVQAFHRALRCCNPLLQSPCTVGVNMTFEAVLSYMIATRHRGKKRDTITSNRDDHLFAST